MTAHPTPDVLTMIALGEDGEPAAVEHVAECRACFAEIEALQQVVLVGRSLGPDDRLVAPHQRLWQQIAVQVDAAHVHPGAGVVGLLEPARAASSVTGPTGADDGATAEPERQRPAPPRRRATVALAAAAALVVGLGGGFALKGFVGSDGAGETQLNALPRWPGAGGTASVEKGADGARTLVVTMVVPPTTPVDGTFEVWMSDTRASDMLPIGTLTGMSGRFPIPAGVDVASHPIVDVSLEPPGDQDPAHSAVSVVRGRLAV